MSADKHIIDLGLTLGYSENCNQINAGAGVNAGSSSMNLNYLASDSMSELVWSPHRGPTVKRTLPPFPNNGPFPLWNVGPSYGDPSSSQGIRCKENDGDDDDKIVADGKDPMVLSRRTQNETEVCDVVKQDMDYAPESTAYEPVLGLTKFSLQCFHDSSMNLSKEIPSDHNRAINEAFNSNLIQEDGWPTAKACSSPVVLSQYPETEEAKDANEEDSGENDLLHIPKKDVQQKQNEGRVVRASSVPLGSHSHRLKKDKDRALSEGNVYKRRFLDSEDNDSQGSVESCHSACMLGKRTWNPTDDLMIKSKRMKTGVDENFASTSMIKRDNSFMNYLSNLVKGFAKVDDEGPSLDLTLHQSTHEDVSRKKGFQTVFQSLYCPSTKLSEAGTLETQNDKLDKQEDIVGQPEFILSKHSPNKEDVKTNPAENTELGDQEGLMYKDGCSSSASLANHGATGELSNKGDVFGGMMWITRFTAKVCDNSLNMVRSKRDDCSKPYPQTQKSPDFADGEKCPESGSLVDSAKEMDTFASNSEPSLGSKNFHGHGYQSAESSHKSKTSEAMASTFARRLDAFKHILPDETQTDQPVEVTGNKQKFTFVEKENDLNDENNLNSTSEHLSLPLMNLASSDTADVPNGVFDAVRQLQVSRANVQKWIESDVSLSKLEGLFLRLRLGKWEEGLGGTGYYVARITEQSGENSEDGKKSISVNVGGLKCLVGSQYISNNGLLEDEVALWWRRTLKTGGTVPSREDLDANLRRRIALGL